MVSIFTSISTRWRDSLPTVFSLVFGIAIVLSMTTLSNAQAFTEDFAVVPVPGFTTQNNSTPNGTTGWFQGNTAVFPAQAGATNSYIGANFNNSTGANTISNWLVLPNRTMSNGDVYKFWTRTTTASPFPDRMQVRLSTNGASTNVGTGPTGVGDFTTVLLDINPTYEVGGYPEAWTETTVTISGLAGPTSGRVAFRYFVENGGPTGDNSNFIGIDTLSYTPAPAAPADGPLDYNGDGRTDYTVVRNTGGGPTGQITWYYNPSSGGATVAKLWGIASDEFVSGNWDTDGSDDIAVWRPGVAGTAAFYVLRSSDFTALVEPFGQTGDDPSVVDDYNGDGKTDFAVYRSGSPSTWYYRTASGGPVTFVIWGQSGDFPIPGDFDGNNSADFSVQRPTGGAGVFWTRLSTGAVQPLVTFGLSTDSIAPGDYDGDGKTDIAAIRSSGGALAWYILQSSNSEITQQTFGVTATDNVAQGDYNGDGKTDIAIWRAGTFWVSNSGGAVSNFGLGTTGDFPVANYNTH